MNWEAIGAVGEILGALGVIVTLAYLALQIKYTRNAWNRQNERDLLHGVTTSSQLIVEYPEIADLLLRGQEDFASLSETDKLRLHQWLYIWLTKVDLAIRDKQAGGFGDLEQLEISLEAVATALRPVGIRPWWDSAKWLFSAETQAAIDQAIEQGKATSRSVVVDMEHPSETSPS